MAGGRASPTATLLRNSRLFSLPPPIPRPTQERKSSVVFESQTATAFYPSHAAIQTTQSSISRGDWGLKQSLPSKAIGKTPNSTIRIGDIESIDYITEFESATDLTMTLLKFQELGLPITRPPKKNQKASSPRDVVPGMISVFESHVDNIQTTEGDKTAERWKFKGPWLAMETERGFQEYIRKTVRGQKTAFRKFLREELAQKEWTGRRESAINEGKDLSQDFIEVSDQQVDDYIKHLRSNPTEMRAKLEAFLDLPRATTSSNANEASSGSEINYAMTGPPKTHPSAGLTYLRTASRIHNHPILGPQYIKEPVQGRLLTPQVSGKGRTLIRALVGVGGVVAVDSHTKDKDGSLFPKSARSDPPADIGSKCWFHPERASVSDRGRIKLRIQRATGASLTLFTDVEDGKSDFKSQPAVPNAPGGFMTQSNSWRQSSSRFKQGYGIENETEPMKPTSNGRVQPLDPKEAHATSAMLNLGRFNGS